MKKSILLIIGITIVILIFAFIFLYFVSNGSRGHIYIDKTTFLINNNSLILDIRAGKEKSGIYVASKNGSILNRLTFPGTNSFDVDATTSFDGSKITFSRRVNGLQHLAHIFLMDQDGKNQKQITSGTVEDEMPLLSPDNQFIYFIRREDLSKSGRGLASLYGIYSIKVDGSNFKKITRDTYFNLKGFSISRDGKKLVYIGSKYNYEHDLSIEPSEYYRMLRIIDLTTLQEVDRYKVDVGDYEPWPSAQDEGTQSYLGHPSFSPDSNSIAFMAFSKVKNSNDTTHSIYLYNIKTALTKKIADVDSHFVQWPSFSPDGKELVFCSGFPYICDTLWIVNVDGTNLHKITDSDQLINQVTNSGK